MPVPQISRMNTRIRVEVASETPVKGYRTNIKWAHYATIWAREIPRGSTDVMVQDRRQTLLNIDFETHYRKDIIDTMRIIKDSTQFQIMTIDYDLEDHLSMVIHCIEEEINA